MNMRVTNDTVGDELPEEVLWKKYLECEHKREDRTSSLKRPRK